MLWPAGTPHSYVPRHAGRSSLPFLSSALLCCLQCLSLGQSRIGCSESVKPDMSQTIAGVAQPPARVPFTSGISANALPYRFGDSQLATGTPSISEALNRAFPCWLHLSGELRDRAEAYYNSGFKPGSQASYDLTRVRLGLTIIPTSWVRFVVATQDSRVFDKVPAIPPYQDTFDFNQAYVEMGRTGSSGFGLRVGRQELSFGNGRFIGNSWWQNVSRSFDAVRASYERGPYRVDAFLASVVIERNGVIAHHNQGNNLSGLYGTLKNRLAPRSQFEPFVFWHVQHGAALKNASLGHLDQWTSGFRFLGALPAGFDYRTEMALQRGELGPSAIGAWTGHWVVGNTLNTAWKLRPFVEYNYASGDPNSKDLTRTATFDPLYPSSHDKLGLADQIGWRNIRDIRVGLDAHPAKKWSANVSFYDYWLANPHDALYPTRGAVVARDLTGKAGTHVGWESDFQIFYKPGPQIQIGAGLGRLFAGPFLKATTKGQDFTYPYLLLDYVF